MMLGKRLKLGLEECHFGPHPRVKRVFWIPPKRVREGFLGIKKIHFARGWGQKVQHIVVKKALNWGVKKQHFVRGWSQKVRKMMLGKRLKLGL